MKNNMDFIDWLQEELDKRGWSRSELIRQIRKNGHKLTGSQLSRIMNREQEGTVEVIIGIASGLSLPREEVFRARGWLLSESIKEAQLKLSPEVVEVAEEIERLPLAQRHTALRMAKSMTEALREQINLKEISSS